jgi:hypothetical protein
MNRALFILIVVACAAVGRAAPAGHVSRVLRTFDFEERRLGNAEELPMHWIKVEGPGLPHYVNGKLSTDRAHSGQYSFRFDLNGGSAVYRYGSGQIPVHAGGHYRIEGFCQTTVLPNARARITAYMTDQAGAPIAASIRHSELYAAKTADARWKKLSLEVSADDPAAAWLVLELELLQPSHYAPHSLGDRTLFTQDIRGSAWFDDVTISQVPQVMLSTERPGNVFRRSDPARIQVLVSDRFTDDLIAQVKIRDADGRVVYQRTGSPDLTTAQSTGNGQKRIIMPLPELRPGWYESQITMTSVGQTLGSEAIDFILLPDDAPRSPPDPRFGIVATDLPFEGWSELPQILPMLSAARVKLAVWSNSADIQQTEPGAFDHLLEQLQQLGITPTACLVDLPPSLSAAVGGGSWAKLLNVNKKVWQPQLAYVISRHANHLDRWQLGADGSADFVRNPGMRRVYSAVYQEFSSLVEKPDLAMPWPAWYELDGELPATIALSVPPSVLPSQLPLYIQDIQRHKGHNLSLSFELLDRTHYDRPTQIRDLAERVIYALSANAQRIDLPLPFAAQSEGEQVVKQPRELLMILRTLITTLSGATYQGKLPIAEGVEAFLFDRHGQGIVALWDRGNTAGIKQLALNLGPHPAMVDLWGNVTPLLRTPDNRATGQVQLTVGPMPFFLVDIDGTQAQLRAGVAVDQPLLESSFHPHHRHIRFTNPSRLPMTGAIKLRAPEGWTINPPTFTFNLNPDERFEREITIAFPYNSFAGSKTLNCDFILQGDTSANFSVPITLQLGLSDVGMQTLALRDGRDVVVQQMISNYGEHEINYTAFALVPNEARQERLVAKLVPGRTVVKRYRFTNVTLPSGSKVRVGVKELEGTRMLNDEVPVQ